MDVFIFLLGGVDFLFLLLLASVEVASEVEVGFLGEVVEGGEAWALVDHSATNGIGLEQKLLERGALGELHQGLRAVEAVQEDLHLWW